MSDDKLDRISEILSLRVAPEVRSLVKMVRVVRWLVASIIIFTTVNMILSITVVGILLNGTR